MTETDKLAPQRETLASVGVDDDIVVLARDPQEMAHAQQNLLSWVDHRLEQLRAALQEVETNLAQAKAAKWRTAPWQRQVVLAKGRVTYFEKVKAALAAGFCIIPNFPIEVIAIRTERSQPKKNAVQRVGWEPGVDVQVTDSPASGAGRYVSPDAVIERSAITYTKKDSQGREVKETTHYAKAVEFQDLDFPLRVVRPQVIDDTARAMALKIFDEIGILPASSRAHSQQMPAGDPMVVGRVVRREGNRNFAVSFLVTWWIDTRALR
jgi:hypothetical protein